MTDQLILLDTARLAKEKGYWIQETIFRRSPTECFMMLPRHSSEPEEAYWKRIKEFYFANDGAIEVSQSLLQRWLRDIHGIHIQIRRLVYHVDHHEVLEYNDFIYPKGAKNHIDDTLGNEFGTHEEALENALQESLKLL